MAPSYGIGTVEAGGGPTPVIEAAGTVLRPRPAVSAVLGAERLRELAGGGEPTVKAALGGWDRWAPAIAEVAEAAEHAGEDGIGGPEIHLEPEWLPPVIGPGKVVGIGPNSKDHLDFAGIPHPETPYLFLKPASTTLLGAGRTLEIPSRISYPDWEGELAVVIGRRARGVSEAEALDHVAGYTPANDFSARDWLADAIPPLGSDWILHKGWDGFTPIGPLIVPASLVPDPQRIGIRLAVDGVVKQDGTTANQVFTVAELVAHASSVMTLEPGDVLLTGTPMGSGFALDPQERLTPGQTMELEVEGVGTLVTPTAPEGGG